jgi:hypothetical protein
MEDDSELHVKVHNLEYITLSMIHMLATSNLI